MTLFTDIAPATGFDLSGDPFIDSLYAPQDYFRTKWATVADGKTQISYSFAYLNGVASKFTPDYGAEPTATQHFGVTNAQIPGIDLAFQRWADVANVKFTKVTETASGVVGDIRIGFSSEVSSDYWGYTKIYGDGGDPGQGDIWIEPSIRTGTFQPYTYDFLAMMHEIGHALGLDHPFEGNIIPTGYDDARYTIMSYTSPKGDFYFQPGASEAQYIIITPGVYDIAAVQRLYGANMTFRTGSDVYTFKPNQPVYQTIWDAGGNDTLDLRTFTLGCKITLVPGTYSLLAYPTTTLDANIGIAFGCTIENARGGSGDDRITGNDAANRLYGNDGRDIISAGAGDDLIDGGAGIDAMTGGTGNDTFQVETAGDTARENTDGGLDSVIASISFKLGSNVENLMLIGSAAINGTGNEADNTLRGNDAANVLSGGGGIDRLLGGAGSDTLIGGADRDILTGGAGADSFRFGIGDFAGLTTSDCDMIMDFSKADGDRINLAAIDANTAGGTSNDAFAFIGSAAFSNVAGQLRIASTSGLTVLQGDTNGDGIADFWIRCNGAPALVEGDLVL